MSADELLLDREAIAGAFGRLGDRLARRGLTADVYVFGGAAMALAYDARRATRGIDAAFEPHGVVLEEACAVADELGWPRWWLNEQARLVLEDAFGDRRTAGSERRRATAAHHVAFLTDIFGRDLFRCTWSGLPAIRMGDSHGGTFGPLVFPGQTNWSLAGWFQDHLTAI